VSLLWRLADSQSALYMIDAKLSKLLGVFSLGKYRKMSKGRQGYRLVHFPQLEQVRFGHSKIFIYDSRWGLCRALFVFLLAISSFRGYWLQRGEKKINLTQFALRVFSLKIVNIIGSLYLCYLRILMVLVIFRICSAQPQVLLIVVYSSFLCLQNGCPTRAPGNQKQKLIVSKFFELNFNRLQSLLRRKSKL